MISWNRDYDIIVLNLWYPPWYWPWCWPWYWPWYHSQPTCDVCWQITQFRTWNHERFQCGYTLLPRRAWPMRGAGPSRQKSWRLGWCVPYARPSVGNVSKSTVGDSAWSPPAPPPRRAPVMRSEDSSSSDAAGAGARAGVNPPARTGRTRWATDSPLRRRRGAWSRNPRPWCCSQRGPSWSGTGRLHEGDNDNGVRMRCGITKMNVSWWFIDEYAL
jgi:hypothetical protein